MEFVRKRYHKDILSSPVLMLNFCPNLLCEPLEPHRATRELLFLVDRSGSMSGSKIQSVKVEYRMGGQKQIHNLDYFNIPCHIVLNPHFPFL